MGFGSHHDSRNKRELSITSAVNMAVSRRCKVGELFAKLLSNFPRNARWGNVARWHKADSPVLSQNEYPKDSWWSVCPHCRHCAKQNSFSPLMMIHGRKEECPCHDCFGSPRNRLIASNPVFAKVRGVGRADDCKVLSGIVYVIRNELQWGGCTCRIWPAQDAL
jgi:hypothetical protein